MSNDWYLIRILAGQWYKRIYTTGVASAVYLRQDLELERNIRGIGRQSQKALKKKSKLFFFYPASLYWAYVIFWLRNIYIYIEALHLHPVLEDVLLLSHCRERIEERPYLNERNGPHRTGPFVARIESTTDTRISLSFGRVFPSITTEPCRSSSNGFSLSPKRLQDGGGRLTVESDDAVSFSQLVLGDAPVRSVISRRYVDNGQSQLLLCNKIFRI